MAEPVSASERNSVTHKLLLADDSVTIQRVVELTFSGENVQVVTVGDGEQAIARIPAEMPDIVLADIAMPKRSGYDVAAFVKGRPDLAHIPVLLLAGAFEPVDEVRAQHVHSDGVLVKPFEPQQVISRVRSLIDKARAASPRPPAPLPDLSFERYEPAASHEPAGWSPEPGVEIFETRGPIPESRTSGPEARPVRPEPPADDYFERLDAAFAQLATDPGRHGTGRSSRSDEYGGDELPTVESLLTSASAHSNAHIESASHASGRRATVEVTNHEPAMERTPAAAGAGPGESGEPSGGRNLVADMFTALFAVEQGEAMAPPLPLPAPPREAPVVTDALVDELTRRVIERLVPDTANALVAQIVSEVAERLVREEIARIKSAAGSRQ
jgi:CheY-like chemotaxis protein